MPETAKYEMMVIIRPDLTQKQTEGELKKLRDFIKSQNGSIYEEDLWGMRTLAYKIKKHESGYYAIFYFEIPGSELKELQRNINLENNILRHLIVKTPANYEIKPMEDLQFEIPTQKTAEEKETKRPARKTTTKKEKPAVAKKEEKEEKKEKPAKKESKESSEDKKKEDKKAEDAEDKKEKSEDKEEKKTTKKAAKKEKGANLEEIDEKLQSIIDDPDIMDI